MSILAIQYPVYKPAKRIIATISNANPAIVTTTFDHNYITGTIVRLIIPNGYGMPQANKLYSDITIIDSVTFSIDIDTTLFTPFSYPTGEDALQYPQSIPIGELNNTLLASTVNVLPY